VVHSLRRQTVVLEVGDQPVYEPARDPYEGQVPPAAVANVLQTLPVLGRLDLARLRDVLHSGLEAAAEERDRYDRWGSTRIDRRTFEQWVDGELRSSWGVKAAARVLAIARQGRDVEFSNPFEGGRPSERTVVPTRAVPGAIVPADTAFAVSQALAWLASQLIGRMAFDVGWCWAIFPVPGAGPEEAPERRDGSPET
jgi:hypothetical protein